MDGFMIDQSDEQRVYGTNYSNLFISNNGGKSWTRKQDFTIDAIAYLSSPGNNLVFVTSPLTGIQISLNGGSTWTTANNGLGIDQLDIVPDPYNSGVLYAYKRNNGIWNETLYLSVNDGQTWHLINSNGRGIAFDADGKTIYRAGPGDLLVSIDQGTTWNLVPYRLWDYTTALSADPFVSGRLFIAPWPDNRPELDCPNCMFTSTDQGQSWLLVKGDDGLGGTLYWSADEQRIYTGQFTSSDGGNTWTRCANPTYSPAISRVSAMAIDPDDKGIVYMATQGGGILKGASYCSSWTELNDGLESKNVNSIVIDPQNSTILYAGTDSGAYVSQNAGNTWQKINDGLLGVNVVYAVAIDPFDNSIYASTPYGIFKLVQK
jgi:photosystem II stability/assembly factor-like uncharacterized protein